MHVIFLTVVREAEIRLLQPGLVFRSHMVGPGQRLPSRLCLQHDCCCRGLPPSVLDLKTTAPFEACRRGRFRLPKRLLQGQLETYLLELLGAVNMITISLQLLRSLLRNSDAHASLPAMLNMHSTCQADHLSCDCHKFAAACHVEFY